MNEEVKVEALNAVEAAIREGSPSDRWRKAHTITHTIAHSRGDDGVDAIIAARESTHGDFTEDAKLAQALKYVMRQGKNWDELPAHMREALEQMQTKVARILAGDFSHPDHWKDLQGYPRLVETRLDVK
jgi:hypothetical protein